MADKTQTPGGPAERGASSMPGVPWCKTEDKPATRWCGSSGHEVAHEREDAQDDQ